MAKEIEHKYLVISDSYRNMAVSHEEILQGYLNRDPYRTVRVRIKGDHGFLTVKGFTEEDNRPEFEYEIPLEDARELMTLCEPPVIEKTRWVIPFKGYIWEVDEFHASLQPLVIAEIEIPSSETSYECPDFIGENVTGDKRFYNSVLDVSAP